jgi:hypothetical protein
MLFLPVNQFGYRPLTAFHRPWASMSIFRNVIRFCIVGQFELVLEARSIRKRNATSSLCRLGALRAAGTVTGVRNSMPILGVRLRLAVPHRLPKVISPGLPGAEKARWKSTSHSFRKYICLCISGLHGQGTTLEGNASVDDVLVVSGR